MKRYNSKCYCYSIAVKLGLRFLGVLLLWTISHGWHIQPLYARFQFKYLVLNQDEVSCRRQNPGPDDCWSNVLQRERWYIMTAEINCFGVQGYQCSELTAFECLEIIGSASLFNFLKNVYKYWEGRMLQYKAHYIS